ncbi:hypothetical protein [Xanthomonas hortorum]|uniref:hypothetical protein n=1 Tax=Xanthomonas hortorum TaxID=56454 RepID=UPI00093834DE|nr:hypothetical protein [Xanthomonas hortorum]APP87415.1 hypothetical protein BI317_25540 [Xanthomonas hortorum pv. gardneri]MCE4300102.1 hypothetical protein [Xanthomonas hortorum pv. vitians]MCE4307350.1 hypothetical protein [Xanthomonas hortorum pv. vitians]MCE4312800.1 hypothetical protein [Xanthomonas hortorum pv. vitians]MCE4338198.1 hypothetical protein [Xanthomonas hortorum pv. vitians]
MHTARWGTETDWYEAAVFLDLFWGGKGSRRHGQPVEIADSEALAQARLAELDRERQRRKPAYSRIV